MKFHRLLGGGRGLASAAAALIDDEPAKPAAEPAPAEPAAEPDAPADPIEEPAPEPEAPAQPEAPAEPEAPAAAANDDAIVAARAEERQRVTDVFASDASNGKERVAASLLAESDMPADKIIALLPKLGSDASDSMLKALASTSNPDLGTGAEATGAKPDAAASWGKTFESLGWK